MALSTAITRGLLCCGIAAPVALIAFVVWAAAVTPSYSHIANTISQLAAQGRPSPVIMGTGFVVFGLLINGFAFGLYRSLQRELGSLWVLCGLLIFGTSVLLSGFFQDYNELPGASQNLEGHLHSFFAQIAVVGLLLAMFFLARLTHIRPGWEFAPTATVGAAVLVAGFGLLFMALPSSVQGLVQRGLYGVTLMWITTISLTALKNL